MKTLFLIFSILVNICLVHAQKLSAGSTARNEAKFNALYLPGGYPELSYERILGKKSAVGLSVGGLIGSVGPNYVTDILTFDFAIIPYYRRYFGSKVATGFFLEGNSAIFSRESFDEQRNEMGVGLGLALGGKFTIYNSWSIEFFAGGGINLNQNESGSDEAGYFPILPDVYPRLGITIGKRF